MQISARQLMEKFEVLAPRALAASWDNVGFLLGDADRTVTKVLVCLEITEQIVEEAIGNAVDLIVAHHPLIFKALHQLCEDKPKNRMIAQLIRHRITVYASHTNYDHADFGLSYLMAKQLGLSQIEPLIEVAQRPFYKLTVFVPQAYIAAVSEAAFAAGAGAQGNYRECGFTSVGQGSFTATQGAHPYIGERGKRCQVTEVKWETMVAHSELDAAVKAIKAAHPYEEVALDVFKMDNKQKKYYLGRQGVLAEALTVAQFAQYLKCIYRSQTVKVSAADTKKITRVALIAGAGIDYVDQVATLGVDAFVTGDVKYHDAVEASYHNLAIFDVGHFHSELIFAEGVRDQLTEIARRESIDIEIRCSQKERSPFQYF